MLDPLAEEFPGRSPYEYTFSNPVRYTDPTGMSPEPPEYYLVNWRGFFVQGGGNGEYLGNVNPNPGSYYELERIKGGLYHKNTDAWLKRVVNNTLGTDLVAKKSI